MEKGLGEHYQRAHTGQSCLTGIDLGAMLSNNGYLSNEGKNALDAYVFLVWQCNISQVNPKILSATRRHKRITLTF